MAVGDPAAKAARRSARGFVLFFALSGVVSAAAAEGGDAETQWTRWLWWLLIAYMFMAQAEVCDEYFCSAIGIMVERFKIPENVAGATVMALGCNGPELVVNSIGLFIIPDAGDVGTGTIVGSEIFNLLVILGGVAVVTSGLRDEESVDEVRYRVLRVRAIPFLRDCFFYAGSIGLLAWTLVNGKVSSTNVIVLILAGLIYVLVVVLCAEPASRPLPEPEKGSYGTEPTRANSMLAGRKSTLRHLPSKVGHFGQGGDLADDDQYKEVHVERHYHNRVLDRCPGAEETVALAIDNEGHLLVANLHRKGSSYGPPPTTEEYVPVSYAVHDHTVELEVADGMGGTNTIVGPTEEMQGIIEELEHAFPGPGESFAQSKLDASGAAHLLAPKPQGLAPAIHTASEILAKPVQLLYHVSMGWCDPNHEETADYWPFAIIIAMFWLSVSSYIMVVASQELHTGFGIPNSILGVTVCAVGTSFPNFWASIAVARKGRGVMAVANALGSNIQNIFLSLAWPWAFKVCLPGDKSYPVNTNGFGESIMWMAGTLALVLVVFLPGGFKHGNMEISGIGGWVLIVTYFIYIGQTICGVLLK